jgi:hypothetical protein
LIKVCLLPLRADGVRVGDVFHVEQLSPRVGLPAAHPMTALDSGSPCSGGRCVCVRTARDV